ncbi:MAG: single-stranded DNA-binding protein [Pirellulales bacterium]|jgi:single-strand DNA-binding protein|nr:single-stranded DNA-binding protein [Pirellulales bacterium]
MASYNRVVLVGNLTRDPELRYISSGTAVTELGLAVNDRKKSSSGEWVEDTQFIDVTLWGRTAEVASEYLGKGSSLLIEGRLKLDRWEKDDKKYSKLRVVGEKMEFLDKRERGSAVKSSGGPSSSATASAGVADTAPAIDSEPPPDDIPF